jgi:uncharacterized protein (DUF111 family)
MKIIYLDCFSGISGDMMVGALCDLGVKPSALEWELSKLEIGDFHMHFERKQRQNIEGVKFTIHEGATHTHDQEEGHDHEHGHEHLHAHGDCCGHDHHHESSKGESHPEGEVSSANRPQENDHDHGNEIDLEQEHHDHDHDHGHAHPHVHGRSHRTIRELIQGSDLSPFVKEHATSIFQRIAVAEGKIHGMAPDDVHFHEVGALDSIADIICACVGLEALGITKLHVSPLHEGRGFIQCAHGRFPLPAPATLEILQGITIGETDETHELITPTGAAIVAEFAEVFGPMPRLKIEKIGYGIGSRHLESRPNVLRAVIGELESN